MNTPAHIIFSLALLGRFNAAKYAVAIAIGAVLPDLFMMFFYAYEKLMGVPENIIWEQHYYQPFWQNIFDSVNSLPLLIIAIGISFYKKHTVLTLMLSSMVIHCLLDLPVHHEDGHRHFFPISDFRFQSPVSYWNPKHYGNIVSVIELLLFFGGSVYLWRAEQQQIRNLYQLTRLRLVILTTSFIYVGFFIFVFMTWME